MISKDAILSGVVMFLLEYFVLTKIYTRDRDLYIKSLIVAPLMIIVAVVIGEYLANKKYLPISWIFVIVALMEIPISLYGYEIKPDAEIWERVLVAGSFGTVAYAIAKQLRI